MWGGAVREGGGGDDDDEWGWVGWLGSVEKQCIIVLAKNLHAEPRSKIALDSHWAPLKRALKKWQCAKNQASRYSASGTNLVDEITQVQGLYFKEMNKTFDKLECYEAVATHPQFVDVPTTSPPFQRNFPTQMKSPINLNSDDCIDEEGFTTPESNRETESPSSPVRPMGVKASKHAKKKGKQRMTEKEEMSMAIFNNKMNMECGPMDRSLLTMQDDHISTLIWHGGERETLDVRQLTANMGNWVLDEEQIHLLIGWDFGVFVNLLVVPHNDIRLITALVERWRPETNSFHFTFSEMTITLEDVYMILGLPITGRAVTHTELDNPKPYWVTNWEDLRMTEKERADMYTRLPGIRPSN
ncbi:hypothetical protein AgCh_036649 [Apium graveolens]